LNRTEIRDLFGRNETANRIDHALQGLAHRGLAKPHHEATNGRSREVWELVGA
jgi:hypothetical protein